MLTGKMVRVRYKGDALVPQFVPADDAEILDLASEILSVYRSAPGRTRGEVDADLEERFGDRPDQQLRQGLAKLLEDRSDFETPPGHSPTELRELVFAAAARSRRQQPDSFSRDQVLAEVGAPLHLDASLVDAGLFADLKDEQRLMRFQDTTAERLLERYNVSLVQAILLRAVQVDAVVRGASPPQIRQMLRAIKFHRLLAQFESGGKSKLTIRLDGPLSLFSATQKYGLQLALFVPTLLLCADFELKAQVLWGVERRPKNLAVTSEDGLVSHQSEQSQYVPAEVSMFAELFAKRIEAWRLEEASDVVTLGKTFWAPDFRLTHLASQRTVWLDVFGFWRKSALERHLAMLRNAQQPFILAISDSLKVDDADLDSLPTEVVRFRNMPLPDDVVRAAEMTLKL